jgi:hypothetical protein
VEKENHKMSEKPTYLDILEKNERNILQNKKQYEKKERQKQIRLEPIFANTSTLYEPRSRNAIKPKPRANHGNLKIIEKPVSCKYIVSFFVQTSIVQTKTDVPPSQIEFRRSNLSMTILFSSEGGLGGGV